MKPKPKKNRSAHGGKVLVPAIPLDLTGRPIFPLRLGDLTLHSIGEVSNCCIVSLKTSVAQLDAPSDWRPGGRGFNPRRGRQHSFMEIDHEIFSTFILSLLLIQEGQLSVSGERMCTILVNRLED